MATPALVLPNMQSVIRRRRAATLLELLIVIAIIMLLLTLMSPAVQAARDAARNTTCADHLKQMGLAFSMHHDALGYLPTGGNHPDPPRTKTQGGQFAQAWGWAYQVLPY